MKHSAFLVLIILAVFFSGCATQKHVKQQSFSSAALRLEIASLRKNQKLWKKIANKQEINIKQKDEIIRLLKISIRSSIVSILISSNVYTPRTCWKNNQCMLRKIRTLRSSNPRLSKSVELLFKTLLGPKKARTKSQNTTM